MPVPVSNSLNDVLDQFHSEGLDPILSVRTLLDKVPGE